MVPGTVPTFPSLYHAGEVTYIRDHFFVDNLELSGISGGALGMLSHPLNLNCPGKGNAHTCKKNDEKHRKTILD